MPGRSVAALRASSFTPPDPPASPGANLVSALRAWRAMTIEKPNWRAPIEPSPQPQARRASRGQVLQCDLWVMGRPSVASVTEFRQIQNLDGGKPLTKLASQVNAHVEQASPV